MSLHDEALRGLDDIDWSQLQHAYGPATDTPSLLHQLSSQDKDVVSSAYAELEYSIYHQGSRYTASVAATPFIARLISLPNAILSEQGVRLLTNIAVGDPFRLGLHGFDINSWREAVQEQETRRIAEDEVDPALIELQAYDAVKDQIDSITALLKHSSAAVRLEASFNISWFPECIDMVQPELLVLLSKETNHIVRATALIALGHLHDKSVQDLADSTVTNLMISLFAKEDGSLLERWASAIALLMMETKSSEYVDLILRTITEDSFYVQLLNSSSNKEQLGIPFADPDLASLAGMALGAVKDFDEARIDDALIKAIPPSRGERTLVLAQVALDRIFGDPVSVTATCKDLNASQVMLLHSLCKVDDFNWHFVNFRFLLQAFALPSKLEGLRQFIQEKDQ